MPRVLVAIRMPDNLKRMIDEASEQRDVTLTSFIVNACWGELDNGGVAQQAEPRVSVPNDVGSNPTPSSKTSLLSSIPGLKTGASLKEEPLVPLHTASPVTADEVPMCLFAWWEDGEQYECLMDKGHRSTKHGQRGMVRHVVE